MSTAYDNYITRARTRWGAAFDDRDLADQFKPYLRSGQRIKVHCRIEGTVTGTVGITTGWKPVFLLMRRSNAMGSSTVLGKHDTIVAVQHGRTYHPVTT